MAMNILFATIPLYISEQVSFIIDDAVTRLDLLRSTNDYLIRKTAPKILPESEFVDFLKSHDESTKNSEVNSISQSNTVDSQTKFHEKIIKIESERQFVRDSLITLSAELIQNGQFIKFSQILYTEKNINEEKSKREITSNNARRTSEMFNEHIHIFRNMTENEIKELTPVITNLRNSKQELQHKQTMEQLLLEKTLDQSVITTSDLLKDEIVNLHSEIDKYKKLISVEERAHYSLQQEIRQQSTSLVVLEHQIMKKYHSKKENMIGFINKYTKNIESLKKKFTSLNEIYQNYKAYVDEDRVLKYQLKLIEIKQQYLNDKAIIIQKWWRYIIIKEEIVLKVKKPAKKGKK